jgi:hypothetical protein
MKFTLRASSFDMPFYDKRHMSYLIYDDSNIIIIIISGGSSISDGIIGIFHWHNPSGRTMALRSTQPLTEMSTTDISWG